MKPICHECKEPIVGEVQLRYSSLSKNPLPYDTICYAKLIMYMTYMGHLAELLPKPRFYNLEDIKQITKEARKAAWENCE